jgi:hypothetical protein
MATGNLPLLLFGEAVAVRREGLPTRDIPQPHTPSAERQAERLAPRFAALLRAMDDQRVDAQALAANSDPDLVLVLETIGALEDFISAANRIEGLEWLFGETVSDLEPDEDFYSEDDPQRTLNGRLFLMGVTRRALTEIVRLWEMYRADQSAKFPDGLARWKDVFPLLRDVRFWSTRDRLGPDVAVYWQDRLSEQVALIRFEIEAWCYAAEGKNSRAAAEIRRLVEGVGGRVVTTALISEIGYHGLLVEIPTDGVRRLLSDTPPELVQCARVMFFRPRGQSIADRHDMRDAVRAPLSASTPVTGTPRVAILDGLPLANHPRLAGRLIVDDPDGWADEYQAAERIHGTAIASLIVCGDLSAQATPIATPVYVRPIMRPDPRTGPPRLESTPDDRLLIDLVHRAVRRIFVADGDTPPQAPTVRVINLSLGDARRPFDGTFLSPWARLLDWLACEHNVLFVVSVGNSTDDLVLPLERESLGMMSDPQRRGLGIRSLLGSDMHRRLISPAESVNALTVGATHADGAVSADIPGRYVLFEDGGVTPYSCIGPGFRRSIKPDVLMPGGRVRYTEDLTGRRDQTTVRGLWQSAAPPGLLAASPPHAGVADSVYVRGSSYAAALATRAASEVLDAIDGLRRADPGVVPERFDPVLVKALLVHGAQWESLGQSITAHRQGSWQALKRLVARYLGYGWADVRKAITCTDQRATLIGFGELRNETAVQFRVPVPPCLHALPRQRKLIVTLAWLSPVNVKHSKYRTARLWVDAPVQQLRLTRSECDPQQVRVGTVQHEVLIGDSAVPIVDGDELVFTVNCKADAGRLSAAAKFALCATLEVAQELQLPIYDEVRARIQPRAAIRTA